VASFRALRLLHPKWLPLHLFTVAACVAMVLLGRWQWGVAHRHHGDIRYYAYAFQWWAFTAFALVMWGRIVLDYLQRPDAAARPAEPAVEPAERPGYLAYRPPVEPQPDDDDPERARFNAYLAELNAQGSNARGSNAGRSSAGRSNAQEPGNAG
jgi:DNA-binding transcriptional regulator of glucitol operon